MDPARTVRPESRGSLHGVELQLHESGKHFCPAHGPNPRQGLLDAFYLLKGLFQNPAVGVGDGFHVRAVLPRLHELEGGGQKVSQIPVELGYGFLVELADAVVLQAPVEAVRHGQANEILRRLEEGKFEILQVIREGWSFIPLPWCAMDRWHDIGIPWLAPGI